MLFISIILHAALDVKKNLLMQSYVNEKPLGSLLRDQPPGGSVLYSAAPLLWGPASVFQYKMRANAALIRSATACEAKNPL